MLKIENTVLPSEEQWNAIIKGMRNPKNSWVRSDTDWRYFEDTIPDDYLLVDDEEDGERYYVLGPNDYERMTDLAAGGPVHAKYRRMIPVYLDITAPLYW